jgi:sulfite reductase beta subunit-like hemoprotein
MRMVADRSLLACKQYACKIICTMCSIPPNAAILPPTLPCPSSSIATQLPNGEATSEQLRYAASIIRKYGEDGCADITTRANLQLRGVKLEDADGIIEGLIAHNMGSFQSGMDSVRNLTGSPIAGLDPHELYDTRWAAVCLIGVWWHDKQRPTHAFA